MISRLKGAALQTFLCLITIAFLTPSCQDENRLQQVDPEHIEEVLIERVDRSWFEVSSENVKKLNDSNIKAYGEVYQRYVENVLQLGSVSDSNIDAQIGRFVSDPSILEVQTQVLQTYPDLTDLRHELTSAWSYYHHYFPSKSIPQHISVIGGFNTPAILTENGVGIALEMFLGTKSVYYDYLQMPVYLRNRMTSKHIAPTVIKGWIESEFIKENPNGTLLEIIINQGKVLYCLDALFPFMEDSLKIAYTEEQMGWAQEHEEYVWAYFIDNELLFSTLPTQIAKFTNDGPFTVDLAKESPSRMGYYIGWQIVRAYMNKQETIDLAALLKENDAQHILNNSKYKP